MRRSALLWTGAILGWASATYAQSAARPPASPSASFLDGRFTFRSYLRQVGQKNLDLIAQRSTVPLAEAQIALARVFPDPQVTAGLMQYDVTHKGNPTATIAALSVPIQIGGQRGARIRFAEANLSATRAELEEFLRGLRATAANKYIDALHARLVVDRRRRTLASLEALLAANEQRFKSGDIGQAAVLQSRVEANQFRADVLDAEGNVRAADLALIELLGTAAGDVMGRTLSLTGDMRTAADRHFDVNALVRTALALRPDLIAARRRLMASNKQIELARANRIIDIDLAGTWQHNFAVTSGSVNAPASDFLGATLSFPIPFSRLYHGELAAAYAGQKQAEAFARGAAVRVETDVRQALAKYSAAADRVRLYARGVLGDADQVLEKILYDYQRGGATLVEVLVAQRTDNDVYLSYYDALADAARALVAVQQASGTWDVDF